MVSDKLKKFAKLMKDRRVEVEWPIGDFRVEGTYHRPEGEHDSKLESFSDIVLVDAHDYDSDSAFPDDEFDRIIQEKVSDNLPSDHFDLQVEETQLLD